MNKNQQIKVGDLVSLKERIYLDIRDFSRYIPIDSRGIVLEKQTDRSYKILFQQTLGVHMIFSNSEKPILEKL